MPVKSVAPNLRKTTSHKPKVPKDRAPEQQPPFKGLTELEVELVDGKLHIIYKTEEALAANVELVRRPVTRKRKRSRKDGSPVRFPNPVVTADLEARWILVVEDKNIVKVIEDNENGKLAFEIEAKSEELAKDIKDYLGVGNTSGKKVSVKGRIRQEDIAPGFRHANPAKRAARPPSGPVGRRGWASKIDTDSL
ncbi:hypothetical protein OQA88_5938 [Cercophora sp. LCS_1]